jgi:hypothetical protein
MIAKLHRTGVCLNAALPNLTCRAENPRAPQRNCWPSPIRQKLLIERMRPRTFDEIVGRRHTPDLGQDA